LIPVDGNAATAEHVSGSAAFFVLCGQLRGINYRGRRTLPGTRRQVFGLFHSKELMF